MFSVSDFAKDFPEMCTLLEPTPTRESKLVMWNAALANDLGLKTPDEKLIQTLTGNVIPPGGAPYASVYSGHQFGHWAGQLGDGRAITLGSLNGQEIQLKGAGQTPYSRSGDGRAVLRSSLREYLASEAMFHLGIPTTRALSLTVTGEMVLRDPFYDGHPTLEVGAICTRVAPHFVRFGHFEHLNATGNKEGLARLAQWCAKHLLGDEAQKKNWFHTVCERTAHLMVDWMRVGFVHGVMNTDNMAAHALTIDYGPYGWLEKFEPHWTPNTTDLPGRRYSFTQQPQVALWNLERLADALSDTLPEEDLRFGLQFYVDTFQNSFRGMTLKKLGLSLSVMAKKNLETLIGEHFAILESLQADMTLFYRLLSKIAEDSELSDDVDVLRSVFYKTLNHKEEHRIAEWLKTYKVALKSLNSADRVNEMNRTNPKYILRNHMAFTAAQAAERGDYAPLERLAKLIEKPYDEQPEFEEFFQKRPEWASDQPGSSTLSCSS